MLVFKKGFFSGRRPRWERSILRGESVNHCFGVTLEEVHPKLLYSGILSLNLRSTSSLSTPNPPNHTGSHVWLYVLIYSCVTHPHNVILKLWDKEFALVLCPTSSVAISEGSICVWRFYLWLTPKIRTPWNSLMKSASWYECSSSGSSDCPK